MFQIKINGVQEALSEPLKKPDEYKPIYVYAANIEHNGNGKDYGKASISDLVLVPNAKGFIVDEDKESVDPDPNIAVTISGRGGTKGEVICNNFKSFANLLFISRYYCQEVLSVESKLGVLGAFL